MKYSSVTNNSGTMMGTAAKLIKWQRLTIVALLLTTGLACMKASNETLWRQNLQLYQRQVKAAYEREREDFETIDKLDHAQKLNERIIHDLHERLRKYEAKYGEIDPARKAEGVYIGKLGLNPQVDR